MSGSEGESGLGHESERAESCAPTTSAVVASSVVAASSQSVCNEKLVRPKHQKATVKKEKSQNEKKKPVKPAVKYLCPHCDHETTNIVKHFSHKRLHRDLNNNNSFKCHLCAYESKIKGGLQRHVKRVHTKERPFTCSVCDFRAVDKPSMAKHIISKHKQDLGADLEMYIDCVQSNKFTDEEIGGHSPTHGDKRDAAELNESMAIEKDGAKTNANMSPTEEDANYLKEEEGKVNFRTTKNLSACNDIKAQTSEKTAKTNETLCVQKEKSTNSVKKDSSGRKSRKKTASSYRNLYSTPEYREMRARKLTCEFCRKQCGSQRSLLSHFNEHKNENIFCPICHMFIVDSECRQAHIENHLNTANRYTCATCLSTFAESSEVIAHQQRDHRKSINVIMECMFCSFSSRSQERFSRHMTRCHMFGSDGPKHNAFDVSKMKEFIINYERNKIKNNIKTELSDEHEEKYESSSAEEAKEKEQHQTEGVGSCGAPLDDQISLGDLEEELDSSFFDISAHMNDSLDNFQELLHESERLEEIESSYENNKVDQNCAVTKGNEDKDDDSCEPGALSPSDEAGGVDEAAVDQMSVNSLRLTSSLGRKLVKSSVESSGRGFHGEVMDIPINEFHVPFELLKESGAFNDPCQQKQLENSIHLSRIASIANTLCDKEASISAKNLQKARQRKAPKSLTHQSRIPSPDSTSGTK